jgi:hypothetical protein
VAFETCVRAQLRWLCAGGRAGVITFTFSSHFLSHSEITPYSANKIACVYHLRDPLQHPGASFYYDLKFVGWLPFSHFLGCCCCKFNATRLPLCCNLHAESCYGRALARLPKHCEKSGAAMCARERKIIYPGIWCFYFGPRPCGDEKLMLPF